jgi:hypothetical protein
MVMRPNVFVKTVDQLKAGLYTASETSHHSRWEGSAQIAAHADDNHIPRLNR